MKHSKIKKAFIPFITCGDPDVATTKATILEMVKNGADLIEIGIPFSDPTAEGVVIQAPISERLQAVSPRTRSLIWLRMSEKK